LRSSLDADERKLLAAMPEFTAFADAGVDAMLAVWRTLKPPAGPERALTEVAADPKCRAAMGALRDRAARWKASGGKSGSALLVPVSELATRLGTPGLSSSDTLRGLLEHHVANGGGRRWFRPNGARL